MGALLEFVDRWNDASSSAGVPRPSIRVRVVNAFNLVGDFERLVASENVHENALAYNPFVKALEKAGVDPPVGPLPPGWARGSRSNAEAASTYSENSSVKEEIKSQLSASRFRTPWCCRKGGGVLRNARRARRAGAHAQEAFRQG